MSKDQLSKGAQQAYDRGCTVLAQPSELSEGVLRVWRIWKLMRSVVTSTGDINNDKQTGIESKSAKASWSAGGKSLRDGGVLTRPCPAGR